mmetsp:Transcript_19958/g.61963  ORF Transcript_19958/g.61963 Transcript_19958/m.61963 type:complete len:343 (-) Transcript_19958:1127-2155(-)
MTTCVFPSPMLSWATGQPSLSLLALASTMASASSVCSLRTRRSLANSKARTSGCFSRMRSLCEVSSRKISRTAEALSCPGLLFASMICSMRAQLRAITWHSTKLAAWWTAVVCTRVPNSPGGKRREASAGSRSIATASVGVTERSHAAACRAHRTRCWAHSSRRLAPDPHDFKAANARSAAPVAASMTARMRFSAASGETVIDHVGRLSAADSLARTLSTICCANCACSGGAAEAAISKCFAIPVPFASTGCQAPISPWSARKQSTTAEEKLVFISCNSAASSSNWGGADRSHRENSAASVSDDAPRATVPAREKAPLSHHCSSAVRTTPEPPSPTLARASA